MIIEEPRGLVNQYHILPIARPPGAAKTQFKFSDKFLHFDVFQIESITESKKK